jgi:hypothetical protein
VVTHRPRDVLVPRELLRQLLRGLADGREDVRGRPMGLLHAWPGARTRLSGGGDFLAEPRCDIALCGEGLLDLRWCGLQGLASLGTPCSDEVQESHNRLSRAGSTSLTATNASVARSGDPER